MFKIKLNKRPITRHDGTMTIDVSFVSEKQSFTKSFQFPITYTLEQIKKEAKTFIEDYEDAVNLVLNPEEEIDISDIVTNRLVERDYHAKKVELAELKELVSLGVLSGTDVKIQDIQVAIQDKYKPEFIKPK